MSELTPKQELFCQKFIETSNATEAYRLAYDCSKMKPATINREAKSLIDNPKITTRLDELRAFHLERHAVTVDSITLELEQARTLAMKTDQASAMVTASMGKAKLHGLLSDKIEHTGKDGGAIETKDTSAGESMRKILFLLNKAAKDKDK